MATLASPSPPTGPGPTEMEQILQAIQQSENRLLLEMKSVKDDVNIMQTDLSAVRNEVAAVRSECAKTMGEVKTLKAEQHKQKHELLYAQSEINSLTEHKDRVDHEVDSLNDEVERNSDRLRRVEEAIEDIDRQSRKCNVRIFGLVQKSGETHESLKELIIEKVLKKACPDESWQQEDVKCARRVGESNAGGEKLVIMTMSHDEDKVKLYQGRANIRPFGIRVSDDLTSGQRRRLATLRENGRLGYFYKGKLVERDSTKDKLHQTTRQEGADRVVRKARRQLDPHETTEAPVSSNESENHIAMDDMQYTDDTTAQNNDK